MNTLPSWASPEPISAKPKTLALGARQYRVAEKKNESINGGTNGLLRLRIVAEEGMADGDTVIAELTLDFNLDDYTLTTEKVQAAVDEAKERLKKRVENQANVNLSAIS